MDYPAFCQACFHPLEEVSEALWAWTSSRPVLGFHPLEEVSEGRIIVLSHVKELRFHPLEEVSEEVRGTGQHL